MTDSPSELAKRDIERMSQIGVLMQLGRLNDDQLAYAQDVIDTYAPHGGIGTMRESQGMRGTIQPSADRITYVLLTIPQRKTIDEILAAHGESP